MRRAPVSSGVALVLFGIASVAGADDEAACPGCVIQLHIVADALFSDTYGAQTLDIVNQVIQGANERWTRPVDQGGLEVHVQLAGIDVFPGSDPFPATTDAFALLSAVQAYAAAKRPIDPATRDALILITGRDLDGSLIGLAFVGSACGPSSVAIAAVLPNDPSPAEFLSTNVAHQLGHILGMQNDGSGNACPPTGFIMGLLSPSSPATTFSTCSQAYFGSFIQTHPNIPDCLADPAIACNQADLAEPFGLLDLADINAFVAGFLANDTIADIDGNGLFDLTDLNLFVVAFIGGCP
ncbi:MAG: hypothetical protein H6810_06370 [Phycisphaeraceae bacterium]|nr:MAG: hypothetical protein H6810_06370 [Phycisphaeraceae bacterium]